MGILSFTSPYQTPYGSTRNERDRVSKTAGQAGPDTRSGHNPSRARPPGASVGTRAFLHGPAESGSERPMSAINLRVRVFDLWQPLRGTNYATRVAHAWAPLDPCWPTLREGLSFFTRWSGAARRSRTISL